MLALEGRQLGNYNVIRRIRVGGMGAVYEGKQRTAFDRRVAIKVILGNYATDRDMRRRFAREARTVARLHHPHILPLIEYGDDQGLLYLVMPFIEGGTLTNYLRRSLPDLNEVSAIYQQLLDAVEYAHDNGLIHRDIKSSNVLLEQRRSGAPYVYLADFGLVRTSRQAELEQAGKPIPLDQVPGTPHYMAPEQTKGIVTTASDIYALGVLLYQVLIGELPYDDPDEVRVIQMHLSDPIPSPSDHDASIPLELSEVVQIAMAKHAEDRFSSVAELRRAFLAAMQGSIVPFDDDAPANDIHPLPGRPLSTPLSPLELPMPLVEQQRVRVAADSALVLGRQRTTDAVRNNRQRTTEPILGQRRRFTLSLMATMFVPVILLILLIMPHLLGISLFPVGFPLLGADPTATVAVTVQSKPLADTYLLTASTQIKNPDVATRIVPDYLIPATATDSRSTPTTGTATIAAAVARGNLLFVNSSASTITLPPGTTFTTAASIQVQTTQAVDVPPRQNGLNGKVTASAVALLVGAVGNIPSYALNTRCCDGLSVSNPYPFSGGVDTRQVRIVSQADINSVSGPLRLQLQQQVLKQIMQQLRSGEVMTGQPVYNTTITPDSPVGTQVDHIVVQVSVSTTIIVYNRNDTAYVTKQLLSEEAAQTLGNSYKLQGTPTVDAPHVVKPGKNGIVYLSVTIHEVWKYSFTPQQIKRWQLSIKGAASVAALAYLNEQPGVAAVQIHLAFGTDYLPSSTDQIKILLVD